jgi:hypothetical protein
MVMHISVREFWTDVDEMFVVFKGTAEKRFLIL